jgi:membrane protein involved in colicin uptake
MLWFLKKLKLQKRVYVEVAVELAKYVLPLFEKAHPTDERPRKAVEVVANWLRIGGTDFADAAAAAAAAYAAADYAAAAAAAADYAAYAAARAAAGYAICDIIRSVVPTVPTIKPS